MVTLDARLVQEFIGSQPDWTNTLAATQYAGHDLTTALDLFGSCRPNRRNISLEQRDFFRPAVCSFVHGFCPVLDY